MKELGQAFLLCAQTEERLPRSAGKSRMATNDWIFWQTNRPLQDSVIARYYPDFSPPRLRCPMDIEAERRVYAYSYTMNEHLSQRRLFREGPRGIILLAEEVAPNDGSWAPGNPADQLAGRHDGMANVVFGDGHVEQTPPRDATGRPLPSPQ
jgi:prepilin-type processing-associated H-X9-DG protein